MRHVGCDAGMNDLQDFGCISRGVRAVLAINFNQGDRLFFVHEVPFSAYIKMYAIRLRTVVVDEVDRTDLRVVIASFGRMHDLQLFVVEPGDSEVNGCAGRSIAGTEPYRWVGGIDNIKIL